MHGIDLRHIMNILTKFRSYVVLQWKLTVWCNKVRLFRAEKFIQNNSDTLRRLAILAASIAAAFFISHIGAPVVKAEVFVATGAMIGGIISIVFSLSIFAQQNAADFFSSHYFEVYTNDSKEKFIYVAIVILAIISFGVGVGNTELFGRRYVYGLLFAIGTVFVLLDYQYKNVQRKVNPLNALVFIEEQVFRFLQETHTLAESLAEIFRINNPSLNTDLSLAQAYSQLGSRIVVLDKHLESLIGISMRLAARNETLATKRGLDAICRILSRYFELRESSSIVTPAKEVFFAYECDSSDFLRHTLESLNSAGEQFIRQKQDENAAYIVSVYEALAEASKGSKYINNLLYDAHPILETIHGYLKQYIDYAHRENNVEVIFQSCRVFGGIGIIAQAKGAMTLLSGAQDNLLKNAQYGLLHKSTIIPDECNKQWLRIMSQLLITEMSHSEFAVRDTLNCISKTALLRHSLTTSGFMNASMGDIAVAQPYTTLSNILRQVANAGQGDKKKTIDALLAEFVEELNKSLRQLSETIKSADSLLTNSIAGLLDETNEIIIDRLGDPETDSKTKDSLRKWFRWNLHLPYWFTHHSTAISNNKFFADLADVSIKAGIHGFTSLKDEKILIDASSAFFSIVKNSFHKIKQNGYDEPRLMLKLCFLGALALKQKKYTLFEDIQLKIYEFEYMYEAKYTTLFKALEVKGLGMAPRKEQLFVEVWRWRDNLEHDKYNSMHLSGDSEEYMLELVSPSDIDRFMYETWQAYPADSEIAKELEETPARKALIKKLAGIICSKISTKPQ